MTLRPRLRNVSLVALLAVLATAACHHAPPASVRPGPTVRVLNRSGCWATVWVARDSAHTRLGNVADGRRAEWPVPRSYVQGRDSVRFLAFRRGDARCVQTARRATAGVTRFAVRLTDATDSALVRGVVCTCSREEQRADGVGP